MTESSRLIGAGLRFGLWCLIAFALWVPLEVFLRRLRMPLALAAVAALCWVGAGLTLRWVLPAVAELISLQFGIPRGFLTMR